MPLEWGLEAVHCDALKHSVLQAWSGRAAGSVEPELQVVCSTVQMRAPHTQWARALLPWTWPKWLALCTFEPSGRPAVLCQMELQAGLQHYSGGSITLLQCTTAQLVCMQTEPFGTSVCCPPGLAASLQAP